MASRAPQPLAPLVQQIEAAADGLRGNAEQSRVFWRMVEGLDSEEVKHLQRHYGPQSEVFKVVGGIKYLDLPYWIADKIRLAFFLGLHDASPRAVLDIGMGAGHFCAVCQYLGHVAVGTDIHVPMYDDICRLLRVDRRLVRTKWLERMPDLGQRFDFITIIKQNFNIRKFCPGGFHEHWHVADWAFFLDDLVRNHLADEGDVYISLNKNLTASGSVHDDAFLNWGLSRGGEARPVWGDLWFARIGNLRLFQLP